MSWDCPSCGEKQNDDLLRCFCGYELAVQKETIVNKSDYYLASGGQRFANLIIDYFTTYVMLFIFGYALHLLNFKVSRDVLKLMAFVMLLLYYIILEYFTGKTVGKYITKTKAVTLDGSELSITQSLVRTICRFIPFDQLSFLFCTTGWHDKLSKTIVISLKNKKSIDNQTIESVGELKNLGT